MLDVTYLTKIGHLINLKIDPIQHNCNGILAFDAALHHSIS